MLSDVAFFVGILLRKQKIAPENQRLEDDVVPFGANFGLQGRTRPVQFSGEYVKISEPVDTLSRSCIHIDV